MTTEVLRFDTWNSPVQPWQCGSVAGPAVKKPMRLVTPPVTVLSDLESRKFSQQRIFLAMPLIERIDAFSQPVPFFQVDEIPPISPLVSKEAVNLAVIMAEIGLGQAQNESEVVMPSVHPTVAGAIQFEWHRHGVDLEIEIHPSGEISAYVEEPGKDPVELPLTLGLKAVHTVLRTVLLR